MSTHSSASSPSDRPKTVVVVGGGGVGSIFARQLSAKLDPSKHNLVLVDSRPYALWLIAACRMLVDPKSHLEDKILVPYDEVFNKGPGTFKQGKVIAIHTNGLKEGASSAENEIELDNGERLSFDVLVLATGSRYSVLNPVSFPDDPTECLNHVKRWRERFDDAGNVCLIGGGPVAIELAGELMDLYPRKKVTIVHGPGLLLKNARGIELLLGDYVGEFPQSGPGEVVLRSGKTFFVDLAVPTHGPRANTDFIRDSIGSDALSSSGYVKIKPTLQLESYVSIFALGDIIDFHEGKRASNGNGHIPVVIENVLSYLDDPAKAMSKEYKGSMEHIMLTNGKNGGMSWFPIIWCEGFILGDWFSRWWFSRSLHVQFFRKLLGLGK